MEKMIFVHLKFSTSMIFVSKVYSNCFSHLGDMIKLKTNISLLYKD